MNKYTYHRRYFENIDTEYKAYWLGFLCADACIENDKDRRIHRVSITLNPKDLHHLEKLKKELNFSGNVKHVVRNYSHVNSNKTKVESAILSIPGKEIIKDLEKYGCDKFKTKNLQLPAIKKPLMRHFVRGLFDGDGSLFKTKNKYWRWQLSCNYNIANQIKDLIKEELDIDLGKITSMRSIYSISKAKQSEVKKLFDYMYYDCSVYLDRKYNLYLESKM